MYEEFGAKFLKESNEIAQELAELVDKVSNPEKCADAAIEYASNLVTACDLSNTEKITNLIHTLPKDCLQSQNREVSNLSH